MSVFALQDVDLFVDGLDLSCFTRTATVHAESVVLDATTFCSGGWDTFVGGLKSLAISASGPQDFAASTASTTSTLDEVLGLALTNAQAFSAVLPGGVEGQTAYFTNAGFHGYTPLDGAVGDLAKWDGTWKGRAPLIRGMMTTANAAVTATGVGSGFQLGAVSATQRVWAAVHVLTVAGSAAPTITAKVQSGTTTGFPAPVDRLSFAAQTAKGGQFASALGPVTDTWWRLAWTVSGTAPVFAVRGLIGVQ